MKIHKNGFEISLMDSSRCRLNNVSDMTKTILWYPTQRIKIEEKEKGECTLINIDTCGPDEIEVSRT